jgi:GMP synthase (glutamine-hydrolysing)
MKTVSDEKILVMDFGSQYALLIARRVRECSVYSEIISHTVTAEQIRQARPAGLILSGGPASVYADGAPRIDPEIYRLGIPILGICYGMQLTAMTLGAQVTHVQHREYGPAMLGVKAPHHLFEGLDPELAVWMSHGDQVRDDAGIFEVLGSTRTCPFAAVRHRELPIFGVQFHPEVTHTPDGKDILRNFLVRVCGCRTTWRMSDFIEQTVSEIRERVGPSRVIVGLSGGVDSSVAAVLLHRAIGDQLTAIFVDNGLLRHREAETVERRFRESFGIDLRVARAADRFLDKLQGVTDPEKKRKIIGHEFIEVFKDAAEEYTDARFLAQGTLYPDVIESTAAHGGPTATIKTHHNVGGLPAELGFELVEPFRFLFKDEVRTIGETLGLPHDLVWRHPFPGPGLAVRCLGEITREKLEILRAADDILIEEIRAAGIYDDIAQAFVVLLPVRTVGVMGDERTYQYVAAIRCVETTDFMTADWFRMPQDVLARIANRIINEVSGINRVTYDVSTKPPSTIEWE